MDNGTNKPGAHEERVSDGDACKPEDIPAHTPNRTSTKRPLSLSPEMSGEQTPTTNDEYPPFPDSPPDGVHPNLWGMLKTIHKEAEKIGYLDDKIGIIDDQLDKDGADIAQMKVTIQQLVSSQKTLIGRLLHAETVIQRQQSEITDLKMRSMRDKVIIKTSGDKYKETKEENTESTIKKFFSEEMHIPNANNIIINSSHRMGQSNANYNKMLIARLPRRQDQNKIFDNVKALHGTNFSVTKQVPTEIEDRRQFAWVHYKQAKSQKKAVRFDAGTLVVGGNRISKYDPDPLPGPSNALLGRPKPVIPYAISEVSVEGNHMFQAWAISAQTKDAVREGLDNLLQNPELAGATHVPYAYRFSGEDGLVENFSSDGDLRAGLTMVRILRELSAENMAVYVAHHAPGSYISKKKKMDCLSNVISGAIMSLTAMAPNQ